MINYLQTSLFIDIITRTKTEAIMYLLIVLIFIVSINLILTYRVLIHLFKGFQPHFNYYIWIRVLLILSALILFNQIFKIIN